MGHAEYDRDTLRNEYIRDLTAGADIRVPKNYFPGDDPVSYTHLFCTSNL